MKRQHLLRIIGIYMISASLWAGALSPAVTAYAAEGNTAESAPAEEPSGGDEPSGGEEPSGGGDDSDAGEDSGGSDDSGAGEDSGGGDDGGSGEDSGEGGGGSPSEEAGTDDSGEGQTGTDDGSGSTGEGAAFGDTTAAPVEEPALEGATTGVTATTAEKAKELDPKEQPEGFLEAEQHEGSNEDLIAQQHIVTDMPKIRRDFRFTTIDAVYAFSTESTQIYEERSEDAQVVGTIAKNGVLYELEDEDDGWFYVESGSVRGFVHEDKMIRGEDAQKLLGIMEEQAERITSILPKGISKEAYFFYAQETVPYYENDAYAFRRITTKDTVIEPVAALANTDLAIMEERSAQAREAGSLEAGGLAYIIEEAGNGWVFVESGNVRGFVHSSDLDRSGAAQEQIDEHGEGSLAKAKEALEPEDNKATYYTLTSVKEGTKYSEIREKLLEKALSCVGNPYVWGGTSLTNGADCSGFVQTLYSLFGYHLPRVAAAQSGYGTQIPVSDAAPGDLIFFARNGYVYHVAMYAGDGKTVEAYSSNYGIITKELGDRDAVWATRIIED